MRTALFPNHWSWMFIDWSGSCSLDGRCKTTKALVKYQLFDPWLPRIPFSHVSIIYHLPIDVSEIVAIILSYIKISPQRRFKIAAKVFQAFQTFLFCLSCGEFDAGAASNTFFKGQSFLLCGVLIGRLPLPFLGCCFLVLFALLRYLVKNGPEAERLD